MAAGRHTLRLSGYAPALPTPFHETGELDGTALEWLCHRQIEDGASALVFCGTSAEAPTLSRAEHDTIVRIAVSASRLRIPVIADASSNSTSQAIESPQNGITQRTKLGQCALWYLCQSCRTDWVDTGACHRQAISAPHSRCG